MWRHCLFDEYALAKGCEMATAAADLSKFYERIEHPFLIGEAVATDYPLRLLRLNLSAYRGVRRCSYHRALGKPICARRSVGAGCSQAHGIIKLFPHAGDHAGLGGLPGGPHPSGRRRCFRPIPWPPQGGC